MWMECKPFAEDLERLHKDAKLPWHELEGKTFFITGATGLIGYALTSALLYHEMQTNTGLKVLALVRDLEQAQKKFSAQLDAGSPLKFVVGDVETLAQVEGPVDYIVHCACPTASDFFLEHPVEVLNTIITGTKNVLELARSKHTLGTVFLSSMEVYGQVLHKNSLTEAELGFIDLSSPRSSYPEGKRLAENMCASYAAEYGVPVSTARLVQTFGPGVLPMDKRVFAYMARCARSGVPIQLNTSGEKENMYLYTADAVSAILLLLTKGERGKTYNVANTSTYCSIKEMANLVSKTLADGKIPVQTNVGGDCSKYPPEGFLKLDVTKLENLGWKAEVDLQQMFIRMVASFET